MTSVLAPRGVDFDPLIGLDCSHTGLGAPLANYLASKARRAESTLFDKKRYIGSLALMYPSKGPAEFTSFDLMHWEAQQKVADSTMETRRSHVRDFFNWCVKWDLCSKNPVDRLEEIPPVHGKVYDVFSEAEIEQLCGLPSPDGALMAIMLFCGLRKTECCRLQARHVVVADERVQMSVLKGKGNKDRLVPMNDRVSQAVAELTLMEGIEPNQFFWYTRPNRYRPVQRQTEISSVAFQRWWAGETRNGKRRPGAVEKAGVRYRNVHMTRHTFATRYLRKGGRLERLSMVMGHSSIRVTFDLYAHLDMSDVYADMETIGF